MVIFTGIKINSGPLFIDKIRTSILTDEYFTKIEKDGIYSISSYEEVNETSLPSVVKKKL
ncbi:hypothetical protein [Paraclostridium sordellii]|uniref:hypothetical protein n=1 Tax=Paraclostridium sordellii TaxID=1505 RepID=UPI0005E8D619|nr:hypothetical protein [Paeniclostridium sordellii]CEN21734.1 Uncharacterised protein [[Clostridium] sordellii] [Paeniclostridium sordellii]CEP88144.1 Uncharacterised protein [[Clostridium] sordellii] [Paeniclostridium sordellii]CEP97160.1 Uncharacterised protein [[Clostridium] sordellii] [Paeniclostridium sordellii]CEQ00849.1 Uncharacterised protein [[Clostridium] sordellii] [Paeniclostridium sordellii]